jgi:MFS family permease
MNSSSEPLRQPRTVALLVAGAMFMEQLDGTVIATALPQMAASFEVAAVDLNIGMSAYLLTLAVFIPASGWGPGPCSLRQLQPSRWRRSCAD